MHISDYLKQNSIALADKPAIIFKDQNLSWSQLWQAVEAAAGVLDLELDAHEPQVVGLLMANSIDYVVAYLAIVHLGHIAAPVDVIFKELEIAAVVHQIGPVLTITDEVGAARLPADHKVLLYEWLSSQPAGKPANLIRQPADKQVASLLFTSGTTGKPKAVPNTHTNHVWNIQACSEVWNWTSEDSLLVALRLSHMHGLVICLSGAIYHGNTIYLQENFDVEGTAKLLASGKITMFTHTPYAYIKLADLDQEYDFSKVRVFISGAAPLPPATWHKFKDKYAHEIVETYGSTETGRIAGNRLDERGTGSPGYIMPGVSVKIDGGEVLVKSPGVFPGYWHNKGATKAGFSPDGFWHTGDLGEIKNGRLVLKGRLSERIRRFGYTVSPRDVEWAMHQFQPIQEVYVMGLSAAGNLDDRLIYFIASDAGSNEIMDYCRRNLPSVWSSDKIIMLDQLPRTRSGKPDVSKLKEMVEPKK